jgi:hypothetical protein
MNRSGLLILAALTATVAGMPGTTATAADKPVTAEQKVLAIDPMVTTENLLKESKLSYSKASDTAFKVIVEINGEATGVVIETKKAWKDSKGDDVYYLYIWTTVLSFPKNFKAPEAMLLKRPS